MFCQVSKRQKKIRDYLVRLEAAHAQSFDFGLNTFEIRKRRPNKQQRKGSNFQICNLFICFC